MGVKVDLGLDCCEYKCDSYNGIGRLVGDNLGEGWLVLGFLIICLFWIFI